MQAYPKPVKEAKRVKPQKFSSKVAKEIKERDGGCIICRSESQLTAHHVYFHTFERVRDGTQNNIDKGVTLCLDCHTGFKGVHNGNELIDEACHLYLTYLYQHV
jgi:hypothetical protein